jgi:hypothetical protein
MELDRNRAITNLKMRILVRENEKKKLQAIIAFSQSPKRRKNALDDLADILKEIKRWRTNWRNLSPNSL